MSVFGDVAFALQTCKLDPNRDVCKFLINRLCDNLGLQRDGQLQRIRRHAVLTDALVALEIQTAGGPQQVQCLRVDALPLWLAGIQASRVKEELREKLIRYQKEAAQVLWQAFKPQILTEQPGEERATSTGAELAQLAQIAEMGRAITRMAEEQIELRRRMDTAARAFQGMRKDITDVQVRLGVLEGKLSSQASSPMGSRCSATHRRAAHPSMRRV